MKKEDKSIIIQLIAEHEMKVFYAMIGFFIWLVLMIFTLKEAQAVISSQQEDMKVKIDKMYEFLINNKK